MEPWYPLLSPFAVVVSPKRRDVTGEDGPTPGLARGPNWRASSRGLHVPATVDLTIEQQIVEAGVRLPERGMITGWAALRLAGAAYFEGRQRDVPVLLPHASRMRAPRRLARIIHDGSSRNGGVAREKRDGLDVSFSRVAPVAHVLPVSLTFHTLSCSRTIFASIKSRLSTPSVNLEHTECKRRLASSTLLSVFQSLARLVAARSSSMLAC